ncbi:ATP-dependent Clp protease adaptor protein ClpS [Arcanobacterium phocae]|uniref:ATP-dependent Clp protease adapter protein ClpS n=1 Tax=Arcanobacterium phocae TaxID=131112 RepID=A0A1H2LGI5_9ACTO|nr:ATP-dependent Clp protease adapter ClpS [Arcanobacterium phocae]SDU80140.1 ATP-dependent Clp protease adaptor protein ClpS [Arcanobacterium phocae]
MTNSVPETHSAPAEHGLPEAQWRTVVHNDPVNLMTYVQWVFETYFGMTPTVARARMLTVHREGRAVVASGGRESMERHVQALHGYGLRATLEQED